jgi:5,10-methylenetetrahydromethanopterin reductase
MTASLSLGVLLFSDGPLSEMVSLAQHSENLGYDYFWYTDVRFARECYVGLAAAACRTSRIKLGTGVTDPYSRHPAITTCAIATLDELSEGRAVLGLGTGGTGFRELGLQQNLPIAAMRETVTMVRRLLSGETVTCAGKVVSIDGGRLSFTPQCEKVPIYFATHGPQMTRLAGEIADGVLIANTLRPEAFAFYLGKIDEGLAKGGRAPHEIDLGLRVEACISEDQEAAEAVMRKRVASRVLSQHPHWDYLTELGVDLPQEFLDLGGRRDPEAVARAAKLLPAAVLESMVLAGDPAQVAEQLARALHPRITQLTLRPHAAPGESLSEVVRCFAEDVFPRALQLRSAAE